MSFKQINLDDQEQAKKYQKDKEHKRFLKDNKDLEPSKLESSFENQEDPTELEKEIGTNMLAKVVKIDQLRVRKYPEGEIIKLINKNDEVRIISSFDDIWFHVELPDGTRGYCMKAYLMTFVDDFNLDDKSRRCKTNV